jgi:hypothetical protein
MIKIHIYTNEKERDENHETNFVINLVHGTTILSFLQHLLCDNTNMVLSALVSKDNVLVTTHEYNDILDYGNYEVRIRSTDKKFFVKVCHT